MDTKELVTSLRSSVKKLRKLFRELTPQFQEMRRSMSPATLELHPGYYKRILSVRYQMLGALLDFIEDELSLKKPTSNHPAAKKLAEIESILMDIVRKLVAFWLYCADLSAEEKARVKRIVKVLDGVYRNIDDDWAWFDSEIWGLADVVAILKNRLN